jgi:4-hydroxybenzoate polyprenyltransferase
VLKSDALIEGCLRLAKTNPLMVFMMLWWRLRGQACLKARVASRTQAQVPFLAYNEEFVGWLREESKHGRRLVMCAADSAALARPIADHLGLFEEVIAHGDDPGLHRDARARLLETRFGAKGFDYAGHDVADISVWKIARNAIVVAPGSTMRGRLTELSSIERQFESPSRLPTAWLRALRLHQWAKNVLIFVPAVVSHRLMEVGVLGAAVVAFVSFGLCASATYIVNDLLDLEADRAHVRKRSRPFASGELAPAQGIAVAVLLLATGLLLAIAWLPTLFMAVLLLYLIGTFWYSWALKRIAMVDVLTLSGLYTVRVIAGSAAILVEPSFWLLAFSMFMFLSLALVKRYTELRAAQDAGRLEASGRGYTTDDLGLLLSCGTSSAFISVLVLSLYVNGGTEQLYRHPKALWLLCPLMLYWVCRVWRKTHRGELHDDPVVFAIKDRPSLLVAFLCAILLLVAT